MHVRDQQMDVSRKSHNHPHNTWFTEHVTLVMPLGNFKII